MAQLLCCIPLTSVEPVLTWLTAAMPQCEQKDLLMQVPHLPVSTYESSTVFVSLRVSYWMQASGSCSGPRHAPLLTAMSLLQIQQVVPDSMLLQLLVAWLSPRSKALSLASAHAIDIESVRPWNADTPKESPECCREAMGLDPLGCPLASLGSKVPKESLKSSSAGHAPLKACLSAQRRPCLSTVLVRAPVLALEFSSRFCSCSLAGIMPVPGLTLILEWALVPLRATTMMDAKGCSERTPVKCRCHGLLPEVSSMADVLRLVYSTLRMCTRPSGRRWTPLPARRRLWQPLTASSQQRWLPWWSACASCALCAHITRHQRTTCCFLPSGVMPLERLSQADIANSALTHHRRIIFWGFLRGIGRPHKMPPVCVLEL